MLFDIRSLLIAVALANLFCAAARFLLWRMHPAIPGLGRWALAGFAAVAALFLIFLYGIKHWPPLLSLSQMFVVIGLVLAWDGFRRFLGLSPLPTLILTVIAALVFTWIATVQLQHALHIRALINAIIIVILSALIARELLTAPKPIPIAVRATGWIYALNAVVFFVRAVVADPAAEPLSPLNLNGFTAFMLLWWLCMTIAITLGMVLMTTERLQADLDGQANRDPLTGALNRRAFPVIAENAIAQSRRYNKPLSVLMMDLDNFKQINDRLGHHGGDMMLCRFVEIVDEVLRDEDIFCRFGGEEFVALLPNASDKMALVAAERLRNAVSRELSKLDTTDDTQPYTDVTVSIGIAQLGQDEDIESLLSRADTALYQAKDNGRNYCELAESTRQNMQNVRESLQS